MTAEAVKTKRTPPEKNIKPEKQQKVQDLIKILEKYPVVALANIKGIGDEQLQSIRQKLRGQAVLRVVKNSLLKIALEKVESKPNLNELGKYVKSNCLLLATEMDPFKLQYFLNKNKSQAPAKVGQVSPIDIVVPGGNTGFQPGPILTQFQAVGLSTKIQTGTIHIERDTVVAKPGDEINLNLVIVLSRLGIRPMEVGITLSSAYEDELVITEDTLQIDVDQIVASVQEAAGQAFNLAFEIAYITTDTIKPLIAKANTQALNIARKAQIVTPELVPEMLSGAENQALHIAKMIKTVDKKTETKEDKKSPSTEKPADKEKKPSQKEEKKLDKKPSK